MRYLTLFLLIIFVSCASLNHSAISKEKINFFLKRHTYLIFHKSSRDEVVAAGFFIKNKSDLFFVTANHVATIPVDSLTILLDKSTNSTYTIGISDGHGKNINTIFGEYDLYFKKVNSKIVGEVNTVNKFIPDFKYFDFTKMKKIVYFGFPKTNNEPLNDFKTTFPELVKSEDTIIGNYNYFRFSPTFNKYDSVNFITKSINGTYSGEGDSGSPVFFVFNNQYYFGGMCTGGNGTLKVAYILRPDKLLDSLIKFSR